MVLRYIATESRGYGGTGHVTGVIPAATQSGDVLIGVAAARSYDPVIASSGFTTIRAASGSTETSINYPLVAYRILGSQETPPSSVDFSTVSTVSNRAASVLTYRPSTSIASLDFSTISTQSLSGDDFILGGEITYEGETFVYGDIIPSPIPAEDYGRVAFVIKEPGAHVRRGLLLSCVGMNTGDNTDHVTYTPDLTFRKTGGHLLADRLSTERADTIDDGGTAQRMTIAVMEMKLSPAGWRLWVSE